MKTLKFQKIVVIQIVFFNEIDFSSVLFSIKTSSQEKINSRKNGKSFKDYVIILTLIQINVIRMEENEDGRFWYIRGKSGNVHMQYVNIMK